MGGLYNFLAKLSPEGQKYYSETVRVNVLVIKSYITLGFPPFILQMSQTFPTIADGILGVKEVERSWYWCIMAMVRADYQGKGIAKAMFELAYQEVCLISNHMYDDSNHLFRLPNSESPLAYPPPTRSM